MARRKLATSQQRAPGLTDEERRGLMLPGDAHYDYFASLCAKQVATAPYATLRPIEPRARTAVFLDAFAGGSIAVTYVDEDETDAAPGEDVVFGCALSSRLLSVALDALPLGDGQVAVTWHGRYAPVSLRVGEMTAFVMPRRCCAQGQARGVFYRHGRRCECPCRDCAAGRRWGW